MKFQLFATFGTLLAVPIVSALTVDLTNTASVKTAAASLAQKLTSYYTGHLPGGTPGLLPDPYYWWEAGAMFGALIDYWYYTGDTTYNQMTSQAMLFQSSFGRDFQPPNQTKSEGNDDQAFWAMAAMSAAENKFPNPPADQPQWLALAQAVFNLQAARWDNKTCGGGLRWQFNPFNNGWTYKNSISNGCFFNIAARLGAYTGNSSYLDWADRMWDWTNSVGLMSPQYQVFDGTDVTIQCARLNHDEWSYNVGVFLYGAAMMWNQTTGAKRDIWKTRVQGLLDSSMHFFANGTILTETLCEGTEVGCNTDQKSFKGYLARWMAASTKVAPWTYDRVHPLLLSSATAAAQSCGGADGVTCGVQWTLGHFDGVVGVGQQMTALEVIQSTLVAQVKGPVTNTTGGISVGDPSAGTNTGDIDPTALKPITTADRAGAGILTAVVITVLIGGAWWMLD